MLAEENNDGSGGGAVRIVQITDSHLFAQPENKLGGLNCQNSFEEVVKLVESREDHIDCIVCTGDIAQDASISGYRRFKRAVESFGVPHRWIPGNHDVAENLKAAVGEDNPCLEKVFSIGGWRILMLDSCVEGEVYGRLSPGELEFLDETLGREESVSRHVLVCVHHNPLPVKASWLQKHALRNSDEFFAVLDRHPNVRCVLWGHIHQEFDGARKGVRMLASPSTCVQFHPSNDSFTLDDRNPGYRWLELHEDGNVETGVERVTGVTFNIDFSSTGY